jgi:DNA modification methylase
VSTKILFGDCRDVLATLAAGSVQCCVTSPPYYGLRDYGADGQIGLEPTPDEYVAQLVFVFREVRRVLRDDGVLWLNLGDSYVSNGRYDAAYEARADRGRPTDKYAAYDPRPAACAAGMKPKDLIGIPWMVAFALRADGWYLRRDIIWHKPNPMPESCTDRPSTAHEYVFLLAKSARYFFDGDAIREKMAAASIVRLAQDIDNQAGSVRANGGAKTNGPMKAVAKGNAKTFRGGGAYTQGQTFDNSAAVERDSHGNAPNQTGDRNSRSVWTIATKGFSGAHFATMPPALAERCILSGTSSIGACRCCGAPFVPLIEKGEPDLAHQKACDCPIAKPVPCVVLDPFCGAGTTGLVADRLGRDAILIELNGEYRDLAAKRITADAGLFGDVAT